jgi:hypothetical protein
MTTVQGQLCIANWEVEPNKNLDISQKNTIDLPLQTGKSTRTHEEKRELIFLNELHKKGTRIANLNINREGIASTSAGKTIETYTWSFFAKRSRKGAKTCSSTTFFLSLTIWSASSGK